MRRASVKVGQKLSRSVRHIGFLIILPGKLQHRRKSIEPEDRHEFDFLPQLSPYQVRTPIAFNLSGGNTR